MSEYIFEEVDYNNDPEWVLKDFFNSLNLSGNLYFGVGKIVEKCGFGIEETYCHFPDFKGHDPDFYFEGIMGRDADLVVVVDCQIPADDLVVHLFRL